MILFKHRHGPGGFTRADAMASVFGVLLLGAVAWAGMALAGEKRRVWVCAHHLALLGRAFAGYAHDHDDALPPAVVEDGTNITSWDREIAIYLEPELAQQNSEAKQKQLEMKIAYLIQMSIGPGAARRGRTAKLFHADIRHQSGGLAAPSGKHRRPGIISGFHVYQSRRAALMRRHPPRICRRLKPQS